jgi:hypothetical protein
MQFTSSNKLTSKQLEAFPLVQKAFNDVRFRTWFLQAKFTELGDRNIPNQKLFDQYFGDTCEYSFKWYIVKRPWYKRFSSVLGFTLGKTISTYIPIFEKMDGSERVGHLAHELCHTIGFNHSFSASVTRENSLPYQVGYTIEGIARTL